MDRRTFLKCVSLTSLMPSNASAVSDRPLAAQSLVAGMQEAPTASLVSAKFNGGRSQVNLNFLQIGGDFPFLNCMKSAQSWTCIDNSGPPDPIILDGNGYPISISHGGIYTVFFVPSQSERPGNYVITWNGNGTIFCGMTNKIVSGSKTSTKGTGRYVFSTSEERFVIGIASIANPRITNLQVFHVDDEAALNAGEVFGVRFKQRLAEANFGVVRFLNWQNGNTTNVTTWATRKPIGYVFYGGSEFRSSLYAGLTTNAGAAYSATLSEFTLVDKATVIVKFNVSNSGPCTLNVNGTGDLNILSAYSTALSVGGNSFPVGGSWQSLATLVYDSSLNAWIKQGGDIGLGSAGLDNGCPPELMVRLCAEIGAHPYFVTPPLAIDPISDYMPNLATYCLAKGPPWMIPRFEGPNETWNNAGGFYQTGYANAKSAAYGWGEDYDNWYGKIISVLGQAISIAYSGDRSKYQVLCGVKTATGISVGGTAASDARLASTKYLAQTATPQAPYVKSAAANWVTHICCAQYYSPSVYGSAEESADAAAFAAAAGNSALQSEIASAYANTVNSGSGAYTLAKCAIFYKNWKLWALKFGVNQMCGYEGGYSPDYTGSGKSTVDQLRAASKLAPSLNNFTTTNYKNFVGVSDNQFNAEFPSCFQLSGRRPSNNAWAVLENIFATNSPQWNAIVAFNH